MSIVLEPSVLNSIKYILSHESKIQKIILFGSRAKGIEKNGSDIDLAIVGDNITFQNICSMATKLDLLDLPYKIDLIDFNTIENQDLKDHIRRVGIEL
jgi:predicted nucleotidyltransferase